MRSDVDSVHWLDRAFGLVLGRAALFAGGWGDPEVLARLSAPAPTEEAPRAIEIAWGEARDHDGFFIVRGSFTSPAADILTAPETRLAHVELILPRAHRARDGRRRGRWSIGDRFDLAGVPRAPVCLYLASSGEEDLLRRRRFALPLIRRGVGALILENPYYGRRRPAGQRGYLVRCVTDQLAMNRATVRESKALLIWLRERGFERLGVSGYSMGGHMAALTATRCPFPVAVIPCAAGLSPAPVFIEGVLSASIQWNALAKAAGGVDGARARLGKILDAVAGYLASAAKPRVAILVAAREDGFVFPREVRALHRIWPDAELRWVDGGHVSAYLRQQNAMRAAVVDAFERLGSGT